MTRLDGNLRRGYKASRSTPYMEGNMRVTHFNRPVRRVAAVAGMLITAHFVASPALAVDECTVDMTA